MVKHGGELVYNYAGGVGLRSGDPADPVRADIGPVAEHRYPARQQGGLARAEAGPGATARAPLERSDLSYKRPLRMEER